MEITKELLRKKLAEQAKITLDIEPEDSSPEWEEKNCGYTPGFAKTVRGMMRKYKQWGWCTVVVTASYQGHKGSSYLGSCSYKGKKDFVGGDYYEQMVEDAISEVADLLYENMKIVTDLITQHP